MHKNTMEAFDSFELKSLIEEGNSSFLSMKLDTLRMINCGIILPLFIKSIFRFFVL